MRRFSAVVVIALATLLFVSICSAQQPATTAVPNLIRYGGTLKDPNGAPIAATTGVTFSIYKQQDGGASVWMETQNVTADASGQYSVLLGSTTATGLPSDLFSQEEQRWLGVQVQGQAEQPRVLLVSVPYAFKAHEAETLGGKSLSDFVLAKDVNAANSGAGVTSTSGSSSTQTAAGKSNAKSPSNLATAQGPTNFTGTTSDQIVSAVQSGTGKAIVASSSTGNAIVANTTSATTTTYAVSGTIPGAGVAILGHASSATAQGYGIQGTSDSNIGIGLLGFATAATGSTYGLKGYSSSTGGTGVRGLSTATTGSTVGISASVASPAGTAGVFNNTAGGKILSGQNNGAEAFSVDGSGNVKFGGNQATLSVGNVAYQNLFLGVGAGAHVTASTPANTFFGYQAGYSTTSGGFNVFTGHAAGYSNTTGYNNTFTGEGAGHMNTTADGNTFTGVSSGFYNTEGVQNTYTGGKAGYLNTTGSLNVFSGYWAGYSNQTGGDDTYIGFGAGYANTTGQDDTFLGDSAGGSNTSGNSNTFVGTGAGADNVTGNNNIYIANLGCGSHCSESNTIRIGGDTGSGYGSQIATYVAGIYGNSLSGAVPVVITPSGQLGMGSSSGSYILNGTSLQLGANFNIDGSGSANVLNSSTGYSIGGGAVVSIGRGTDNNLFLGIGAGVNDVAGSGKYNVFAGNSAGTNNTSGGGNTFIGSDAGYSNTSGYTNTFSGHGAGHSNTTGYYNAFTGAGAGYSNTTGWENTFEGVGAGSSNTTGWFNSFDGIYAGYSNTSGVANTFTGGYAGYSNTTAESNTFTGFDAGYNTGTGSFNIFLGTSAGYNNASGTNNIYIGTEGPMSGAESYTIRIGGDNGGFGFVQTSTYIEGIYNATSSGGVPVYINSGGQLGTQTSSLRFKEQVQDMGDSTSGLMKLRPVTFFYKPQYDDGSHTLQFGLIAEEVAKVYPDMVAYDKDGQPYTVKYQYLAPMLLNELQKQHTVVAAQQDVIKTQQDQIQTQGQQIADLQQRLSRLESLIAKK